MSQALAEAGASTIALLDLKQDLGDEAVAELHSITGIPVQLYKVDVRDAKAVTEVMAQISQNLAALTS
jgi:NAD(P)-dependent dehydrogenase (short-subunit alcohol dehydrogenase family)